MTDACGGGAPSHSWSISGSDGYDLAHTHEQEHQERTLASGHHRNLGAVDDNPEGAQDMEVSPTLRGESCPPVVIDQTWPTAHPSPSLRQPFPSLSSTILAATRRTDQGPSGGSRGGQSGSGVAARDHPPRHDGEQHQVRRPDREPSRR